MKTYCEEGGCGIVPSLNVLHLVVHILVVSISIEASVSLQTQKYD